MDDSLTRTDEIDDDQEETFPDYKPIKEDLLVLLRHWVDRATEDNMNTEVTSQAGYHHKSYGVYMWQRVDRIEALLGEYGTAAVRDASIDSNFKWRLYGYREDPELFEKQLRGVSTAWIRRFVNGPYQIEEITSLELKALKQLAVAELLRRGVALNPHPPADRQCDDERLDRQDVI